MHRLSSVIDDILKSDLVVEAATEADTLRKRILTKKKSIELSLESMKAKNKSLSSKITNNNADSPVLDDGKVVIADITDTSEAKMDEDKVRVYQ